MQQLQWRIKSEKEGSPRAYVQYNEETRIRH